jgi:hypothetical protein
MGTTTELTLQLTRLRETPKGVPTWIVEGHPFRLVALDSGWLVSPTGGDARRLLVRHDLLARPLRTRAAALQALRAVLASRSDGGRWFRAR